MDVIATIEQEIVLIRWLRVVRMTQSMILTRCDPMLTIILLLVQSPSKHLWIYIWNSPRKMVKTMGFFSQNLLRISPWPIYQNLRLYGVEWQAFFFRSNHVCIFNLQTQLISRLKFQNFHMKKTYARPCIYAWNRHFSLSSWSLNPLEQFLLLGRNAKIKILWVMIRSILTPRVPGFCPFLWT